MTNSARILVVDDETSMRDMIAILLQRHGYVVATAHSGEQAAAIFASSEPFDLVITDLLMDRGGGLDVLTTVKTARPACEVLVITAYGTTETAVEAMKKGAYDYLTKPFNVDEFLITVRQALERQALIRENTQLRARMRGEHRFADVVGRSDAMRKVIELCRKVVDSQATILLTGESGTGKEVLARSLHFEGKRFDQPFIAVNCGALPELLMESELFGSVKGAFTGADQDKEGLLRAANRGTVFLDEVSELPLPLQVKLLRVLQDRMIRPVGSTKESPVDLRVIAATNRDIKQLVNTGSFRTDLFYRLNVISVQLPPLRARREDIPELIEALLNRIAVASGNAAKSVSSEVLRTLLRYDYPGNVRELANILERAVALCSGDQISLSDLPDEVALTSITAPRPVIQLPDSGLKLDDLIESVEKTLVEQAMEKTGGVRTQAAQLLGISFRSLRYRMTKLGMGSDDDENA